MISINSGDIMFSKCYGLAINLLQWQSQCGFRLDFDQNHVFWSLWI